MSAMISAATYSRVLAERDIAIAKLAVMTTERDEFEQLYADTKFAKDEQYIKTVGELTDAIVQLAALQQRCAMLREVLVLANYPRCNCGAVTAADEPHEPDCEVAAALCEHRSVTVTEDGGRCDSCGVDLAYDTESRNWKPAALAPDAGTQRELTQSDYDKVRKELDEEWGPDPLPNEDEDSTPPDAGSVRADPQPPRGDYPAN